MCISVIIYAKRVKSPRSNSVRGIFGNMDEVIPYKNAYYRQFMELDLAENVSLTPTDDLTSGWSPDEKSF